LETPVLYFYSPRKATASVAVDFPKGLITEWYPHASKVSPGPQLNLPPVRNGHIEWDALEIMPGAKPSLPRGAGGSHYYAARNTDSDPVRIGQDQEKLLFYRGIANFPVPLSAHFTGESSLELRNTGGDPLALAVLFENRGGHIGYRTIRGLRGAADSRSARTVRPARTSLKQELWPTRLVSQGLYRREADAMIETWRDSWFEEGMRVFYLAPRNVWSIVNCRYRFSPRPPRSPASSWAGRKFSRPISAIVFRRHSPLETRRRSTNSADSWRLSCS
jgi:hypothetical protein